ncbi:MAG: DUF1062 domain-containing protein [Tabrizicola sp.]
MTDMIRAQWRIEPITSPQPRRHCSTCGDSRRFRSSGKVRLNANGRKLDAWLIYKCESCDRTWNLPLLERAVVGGLDPATLQAMQQSAPDWVRRQEFDVARLARFCDRVEGTSEVEIAKRVQGVLPEDWSRIDLVVEAPFGLGQRLDRLLARELGLARSAVQEMIVSGHLVCDQASARALKRAAAGSFRFCLLATGLSGGQRVDLARRVAGCWWTDCPPGGSRGAESG